MSYTPNIMVDYNQLQNKREQIEETYRQHIGIEGKERTYYTLVLALKDEPLKFRSTKFIILQPEFSSWNENVREALLGLEIYYIVFD